MAAEILRDLSRATDSNGGTYSGARWFFYATGTTTPQPVYADAQLTTELTNPVVADAGGQFPPIYLDSSLIYRGVLEGADGEAIKDIDPVNTSILAQLGDSSGAASIGYTPGVAEAATRTVQDKLRDEKFAGDFTSIEAAIENNTGITNVLKIPVGTYALTGQASITAYSLIEGQGDMTQVTVPAGTTGIAYTSHAGVFDDHPHNLLKNFRITGDGTFQTRPTPQDGTSKGVSFAEVDFIGSTAALEGMVLELHDIGRHIKSSFGHNGRRNFYRANKIGLKLEYVTSFTEYDIYARDNSTAAVQIISGQNVGFIGGAIEGNSGKAIEYVDDGSSEWGQLNIDNVYFEVNGNRDTGVWSIDVPLDAKVMVNLKGGSYWTNTSGGITSGPYSFGPNLRMEGVSLNANCYAVEVLGFSNVRGPGVGVWNTMPTEALSRTYGLTAPAIFHEFRPAAYEYVFSAASQTGLIIGTKLMGRGSALVPGVSNDAILAYPFGLGGPATVAEDATLDYGDGSFAEITFTNTVGNFNSNYSTIATFSDQTKPFRVFCCLLQPEADAELGFIMSVGGQSITGFYKLLAGVTYRVIFAAQAPMSGAQSFLRMFPLDTSAPVVNFLPIWQGNCDTFVQQLKLIEMLVDGDL